MLFLLFLRIFLVSISLSTLANATGPPESAFVAVFGDVMVITSDNPAACGGFVPDFKAAAQEVLRTGRHVRIDGLCASACAAFADEARANVCITKNARFGFHKETYAHAVIPGLFAIPTVSHTDPRLSPDITAWVMHYGGFPVERFLLMSNDEAARFWRRCE